VRQRLSSNVYGRSGDIGIFLRGTVSVNYPITIVGDPDPQDPHVFGPPGSGSISQRNGSGSGYGSLPFLIKVLNRLK